MTYDDFMCLFGLAIVLIFVFLAADSCKKDIDKMRENRIQCESSGGQMIRDLNDGGKIICAKVEKMK